MSHGAKGDTQSPLGPWPLQGPGWQAHPPKKDRGSWTDWGGACWEWNQGLLCSLCEGPQGAQVQLPARGEPSVWLGFKPFTARWTRPQCLLA